MEDLLLSVAIRAFGLALLTFLGLIVWARLPPGTPPKRIALLRSKTHWVTLRRGILLVAVFIVLHALGIGSPVALLAFLGAVLAATNTFTGFLVSFAFGLLALVPTLVAVRWIEELLHLIFDFLDVAMQRRLPYNTDVPADGAAREHAD